MSRAVLLLEISNQSFPGNGYETSLIYGDQGRARRALSRCWPGKSSAESRGSTSSKANKQQIKKQTQFKASTPLSLKADSPRYSHPFSSEFPSWCLLKQSADLLHPRNTNKPLQMRFIFHIASVRKLCGRSLSVATIQRSVRDIGKPEVCRRGSRLQIFTPDFGSRYQFKASVLATAYAILVSHNEKSFWPFHSSLPGCIYR